ncbi:MAG: hypothetical protein US07_C0015G0004 [Candidatus Levybacteria bacterium GW2011_GWB1_36_18]|nr:MAG: hypothetical protein US07_C0015G0004 [Candidatus Levybacteria bacterium GW2011_GWB1_36_18]
MPGSFSPVKNSSMAPPPVETKENLESKSSFLRKATVSPPPFRNVLIIRSQIGNK